MLSPGEQQRLSFARLLYRGDSDKVLKKKVLVCQYKSAGTDSAVLVQKYKH